MEELLGIALYQEYEKHQLTAFGNSYWDNLIRRATTEELASVRIIGVPIKAP